MEPTNDPHRSRPAESATAANDRSDARSDDRSDARADLSPDPLPDSLQGRELGRSRLRASRLGLGLAALGRPGYLTLGHRRDVPDSRVAVMEARAHEVLDLAWRGGVRYFDAARSYGRAEAFLASWLADRVLPPGEPVVGSKWGYRYTADWRRDAEVHEVKDHSLATLRRQWRESRDALGDRLDLYQVHSATLDSGVLDDPAVHAELAALRRDHGVAIGLSLSGPRQAETLRRALQVQHRGRPLFDVVQATWNPLEPSAAAELARAHAQGLGVIVKEALANGRLSERGGAAELGARWPAWRAEAERLGCTPDALALAAALARPWADVVLSGATTPEQLASNLRAARVPWDAAAEARLAALAEAPDAYWRRRSALPWS